MQLAKQFAEDKQGRRYADVLKLDLFQSILTFLDDPDRQRRMVESELHHDRPALAGVVRELEDREDLNVFFATNPGHVTTRFRQAIGLVVRIIMENNGWRKTGRKGSLGVRTKPKVAIPKTGAAAKAMKQASSTMGDGSTTLTENLDELEKKLASLSADVRGELAGESEKWSPAGADKAINDVDAFIKSAQTPSDPVAEIDRILGPGK